MLRERIILPFILTSISALLLGLSMPRANLNLSALEWFALVPWFLAVRGRRPLYAFLISLWMGILFWGITIYWLHFVTGLGLFLLLPYLGLYFAVFGWSMKKMGAVPIFFVCPFLWMILEFLRGVLLGGFPWLNLSHGQYLNIPLLQWASLGGEGIISGIIILVNLLIMAVFLSRGKNRFALVVSLFLILIFVHAGGKVLLQRETGKKETLRAAVIQPNIIEKWDMPMEEKFGILMNLSYSSLKERPGFLVWPESSFTFDLEKDRFYPELLKNFTKENNVYLLAGSIKEIGEGEFYNSAVLISPSGEISSYDKVKLVPFGEYVPLGNRWPRWKRRVEKIAGYRFSFIFAKEQKLLYMDEIPFGALICFEDVFPALSKRFKEKGARFLVNITDDRWFGPTPAPYQHLAASVLRAVENRLSVIRSANTGVSAFINPNGRIIDMVKKEGQAIFIRGVACAEISF